MSIDARTRMISIRLTESEYEKCVGLCHAQRLPNVSELGRAAIRLLLQSHRAVPPESVADRVSDLEQRSQMLFAELKRMLVVEPEVQTALAPAGEAYLDEAKAAACGTAG